MRNILLILIALSFSACAVQKEMVATGGSRADGTIKLSYQVSPIELPIIDENRSLTAAAQRCQAWGYENAEKFGGSNTTCTSPSFVGCALYTITTEYQCTGTQLGYRAKIKSSASNI